MKHGGDLSEAIAQFGGAPESWLDLSTGINPWTYPVPAELPAWAWQRLPVRTAERDLIEAARTAYNVPAGVDIAIAAGTQALIQMLPHVMTGGAVAIAGPTYNEHAAAFARAGRKVLSIGLAALPSGVTHAVVVNPNNPDGRITSREVIAAAARQLAKFGGCLIVDEAFADVAPNCSAIELCRELPIVVLRSFGKFFGLAGLRLGFAIATPDLAADITAALGPWPVSGPALAIGRAALSDQQWTDATRQRLKQQANELDAVLHAAGLDAAGGTSLFRLARHRDALAIHARLARQHIWTRSFDHAADLLRFGLPADESALARLASALMSRSTAR
jgi:cobalamin biosynthetic protein CobC